MEPFYTTPQSYVPLSLQMQDAMELPQGYSILDGIDLGGLLDSYQPAPGAAPAAPEDDPLNWRQRIANQVAGNMSPGSEQGDRDVAFKRGVGALGDVLLAAALAPDARSRAAVLARALPTAAGAYRQELGGIVKARDEQEDREYQRTQRGREEERYGYEKGQRERTIEQQGREESERDALAGSGAEWRAQFDKYINDSDINDNERGNLSTMFNAAMSKFEANPSSQNSAAVLAALRDAATAANEEEELAEEALAEIKKKSKQTGLPVEELISRGADQETNQWLLSKLNVSEARARAARGARSDARAARFEDLEADALDALLRGEPMTLPDGTVVAPDSPGLSFLRPPRTTPTRMSELDKAVLKNEQIRAIAGSPEMAQAIDPETAGLLRRWIPNIEFGNAEGGALTLPSNEYLRFLEQWKSAGSGAEDGRGASASFARPSGPAVLEVPRAAIQSAAAKDGVSFDEMVKRLEAAKGRPVKVVG